MIKFRGILDDIALLCENMVDEKPQSKPNDKEPVNNEESNDIDIEFDDEEYDDIDPENQDSDNNIHKLVDTLLQCTTGQEKFIGTLLKYAANSNPDVNEWDEALQYYETIDLNNIGSNDDTEEDIDIEFEDDVDNVEQEVPERSEKDVEQEVTKRLSPPKPELSPEQLKQNKSIRDSLRI